MSKINFIIVLFMIFNMPAYSQSNIDDKVNDLLSQLTLKEKISLIHGYTKFSNGAVQRLNIPALRMSDGPCGVREEIIICPLSWLPIF